MADPRSYVGCVVSHSVATPATIDQAGFAALTWTTVGLMVSVGATGDKANDISQATLAGRVFHQNGAIDGGEIPFMFLWDSALQAGQTLVRTNNNTNTTVSTRIVDPDGAVEYLYGVLANYQASQRDTNTLKGYSYAQRVNSIVVRA